MLQAADSGVGLGQTVKACIKAKGTQFFGEDHEKILMGLVSVCNVFRKRLIREVNVVFRFDAGC